MAPAAEVDVTVIAYRHRDHGEWICQVIVGCELVCSGSLSTIIANQNLRPADVLDAVTISLVDSLQTIHLLKMEGSLALTEAVRRLTKAPLELELVTPPVDIGDMFVWETPSAENEGTGQDA